MADAPLPLAPADRVWLRLDDATNLMVVTGVLVLETPVAPAQIRELIHDRLLRWPRFSDRVVPGAAAPGSGPAWERVSSVDVDHHLRVVELGSRAHERALSRLVGTLMAEPLDPGRPLWQMHLVPRYRRGSALVCRVHHCLGDGLALMHVLLSLTEGGTPPPAEADGGQRAGQSERPLDGLDALFATLAAAGAELPGRLVAEAGALARDPARAMAMAASVAAGVGVLGKLALMEPDPPTGLKGPLGLEKRVAWSRPIPLGDLTRVARATGATVNDVLVSAVAGALRRYLVSDGASVPRELSVRAVVPASLRPSADARRLGNEFGLVFLSLPMGTEEPLDRLFAARSGMDAIKRSPEARVTFQALRALGLAPQGVFDEVVALFERKASCVLTNVSGPRQPVSFAGAPIRDIMFWVPRAGRLALGLSVLSYAGSVRLGVASDAGVVPEPHRIADAFVEEVRGLRGWFGTRRRGDSRGGRPRQEANERGLC